MLCERVTHSRHYSYRHTSIVLCRSMYIFLSQKFIALDSSLKMLCERDTRSSLVTNTQLSVVLCRLMYIVNNYFQICWGKIPSPSEF